MMLYIKINHLLIAILSLSFLGLGVYIGTLLADRKNAVNGGSSSYGGSLISNVAINCGSVANSTGADGREWVGESALEFTSGESTSSTVLGVADSVPYKTSRISATEFRYTFPVNPGQKIVRLHFYSASYRGFEKWIDYFSVKAGPYTLLRDYRASLAAHTLGVKYIVKEFCLNVEEENQQLTLTFSPSFIGKSKKKKTYAFVNGIEIISMPNGLYYTAEHEFGARIVGLSHGFHIIDNSTALELIKRLNIGGNSISPMEDFGMFRQWDEDTSYFLETKARRMSHLAPNDKHILAYVAPAKIYRTSWKIDTGLYHMYYHVSWKVPIDLGFRYLVRLHFCELDYNAQRKEREFNVLINNHIAETKANVARWSGDVGIPVYRDYVVIMEWGDRDDGNSDILIALQSFDLAFGLLNGLEIFKLSDLQNNLAAPNLVSPEGMSTSWKLEIENFFLSRGFGTAMMVLIILLSIITYNLRKLWEENVHDAKCAEMASVELSCRCFSLAQIKLATQDFSEDFVIGTGGFGKVYRGLIPGVPDAVAIKRFKSYSKQGAREFWAEIGTLSKLRHIHLVSLIGYCNEFTEMIIVYEYIPGGTLADNLYKFARKGNDCPPLSWEQRLRICIGAARGLEYLHTSSENGIIHRDIKDTNILLDMNFTAKVSDLGLSKLEQVTESTKVKGTDGYLDPDYLTTHRVTRKSDVYSFGILMLVVLSGKPAKDKGNPEEESRLSCFQEYLADGDVSRIVDPRLKGEVSSSSLKEFLTIVECCLSQLPKQRPTMAKVVPILEQALEQHQNDHISCALVDAMVDGHPCEEENIQSFHLSHQETKIFERSVNVISPPTEVHTKKQTQNLASTSRVNNFQSRGKDSTRLRRTLLGWPWKAIWNRDSTKRNAKQDDSKLPSTPQEIEELRGSLAANPLTVFTLDEIKTITKNFRPDSVLGEGGFGRVYKGLLRKDDGKGLEIPVAIKVLNHRSSQGHREWLAEVIFLGQLSHPNLVKLIGYCCQDEYRVLIYEFLAGGSVYKNLFSGTLRPLSWSTRMKIALGSAKGLAFLHEAERPVIYRDFKTSNMLLDLDYNVKLSDFGLAKDGPDNGHSHVSTRVIGTIGYAAPEYIVTGHLTTKSDVYSYGVVLLELLTGRKTLDRSRPGSEQNLIYWARPLLKKKKKFDTVVDTRLEGDYPIKDVAKVAKLVYDCLNEDPTERPTMREVVDSLEPLLVGIEV